MLCLDHIPSVLPYTAASVEAQKGWIVKSALVFSNSQLSAVGWELLYSSKPFSASLMGKFALRLNKILLFLFHFINAQNVWLVGLFLLVQTSLSKPGPLREFVAGN